MYCSGTSDLGVKTQNKMYCSDTRTLGVKTQNNVYCSGTSDLGVKHRIICTVVAPVIQGLNTECLTFILE